MFLVKGMRISSSLINIGICCIVVFLCGIDVFLLLWFCISSVFGSSVF